jgi:ferredoxin
MMRKIVKIDAERCNACGLCVSACHEGAIAIKNGKAALTEARYCDGLGNCLPLCPTGAISVEEADAPEFALPPEPTLKHWPLQIKLVPFKAPYFENAGLLIAADCGAYAYERFRHEFMRERITLIGCPKLDAVDYSEKLARIIQENAVASLAAVRMEVPCCGGIEGALLEGLKKSGKSLPVHIITLSIDGRILERRER